MKKIEGVVEKIEEQTKAVKLVGNDDWFLPNEKSKPFVNKQLSVDGFNFNIFQKEFKLNAFAFNFKQRSNNLETDRNEKRS